MMIKTLKSFGLLVVVGCLCFASYGHAQTTSRQVYVLIPSETDSTISAISVSDSKATTLFTLTRVQRDIVNQVFPPDEISALSDYLATVHQNRWQISELATQAGIEAIEVSPDNQQIAMKIVYLTCLIPQNPVCFGTVQLKIIDATTKSEKLLLNLGYHDDRFLETISEAPEIQLNRMQWTPNQEAIIVYITNSQSRRNIANSAIVVVPVDGTTPFKVGEGVTSASSADSRQIAILARYSSYGFVNTLYLINPDWEAKQFTQSSYSFSPYYIHDEAGIAYSGRQIVFDAVFDTSRLEGGGSWGLFDTQTGTYQLLMPEQHFHKIQSTPDGARLVIQTLDGTLAEMTVNDSSIAIQPIISTPVNNWNLGSDGNLLFQLTANGNYQIMDNRNRYIQTFMMADPLQSVPSRFITFNNYLIDW